MRPGGQVGEQQVRGGARLGQRKEKGAVAYISGGPRRPMDPASATGALSCSSVQPSHSLQMLRPRPIQLPFFPKRSYVDPRLWQHLEDQTAS